MAQTDNVPHPDEPIFDQPIKFELSKNRADQLFGPAVVEHITPKGSPLKRSTGLLNLEAAVTSSPRAKRRSVHGAFDADFSVFEEHAQADSGSQLFSAPHSPRRNVNLRKSTLQQRATPGRNDRHLGAALTRARSRFSLDGGICSISNPKHEADVRRRSVESPFSMLAQQPLEPQPSIHPTTKPMHTKPPHPLSRLISPSSSSSSMTEDISATQDGGIFSQAAPQFPTTFSRSLPLNALRPAERPNDGSQNSFATPACFKMAKPLPQAFMSTGLISKRNRHMDIGLNDSGPMPDTPSKPAHAHILPQAPARVYFGGSSSGFDSPDTPFSTHTAANSPEAYRRSSNIFGQRVPDLTKRTSFVTDEDSKNSPTQNPESQLSVDDLPPTPTKSAHSGPRPQSKGKSNSLRSSIFGRRSSLGPDTFLAPVDSAIRAATPTIDVEVHHDAKIEQLSRTVSPATPSDQFTPPDASRLSIAAEHRLFPSNSYPPATPTGSTDRASRAAGHGLAANSISDVDTAITSRFAKVTAVGLGEFSEVYKVSSSHLRQSNPHAVWAIKKSKKPFNGPRDRQRRMQEVQILQQLRGHEHIVEYVDHWESNGYLYIQTQYCENGNLKDFLTQTGFKGRLEDFRIYKILAETAEGVRAIHHASFIHLDIKPANIFIDWEGVLKVGDFGLASSLQNPHDLDEGDRQYIAPEVLVGQYGKPSDIYSLGMLVLEIAANIVLPDNGRSWQRLRADDLRDIPSLTFSSTDSLPRDDLSFLGESTTPTQYASKGVAPPNFMIDPSDPSSLDMLVQRMLSSNPAARPDIDEILSSNGIQWVQNRRRSGATIDEGPYGPEIESLEQEDVEMVDC